MTDSREKAKKERGKLRTGGGILYLLPLCLLPCLLLRSARSAELVLRGLSLCLRRVIPSLFPFMAVSALLLSSDLLPAMATLLKKPSRLLFGISGQSGSAALLGFLCGFPVAAESGISLYERDLIGKREFCRLMRFANTPGAAFLIGSVGGTLFGDPLFGVTLYLVTIGSGMLLGMGERLLFGVCEPSVTSVSHPAAAERKSASVLLTEAVSSSARAMVPICGFVVFFTVLTGFASDLLSPLLPKEPLTLLLGSLEMTGGTELAATLPSPLRYSFAAFIVGFSGFSVHFQLMSLSTRHPFFFRSYLFSKLLHGLLNALLMGVVFYIRARLP